MAAKRLEIHPEALAELKAAVTWYMARSEISAQRFAEEIDRAVALVFEAPKRWPSHDHNTRKFALQSSIVKPRMPCWFSQLLMAIASPATGNPASDDVFSSQATPFPSISKMYPLMHFSTRRDAARTD